ncbi:MAG TPA: tripartite tricarboxylate transporter substrate-binding protein [Acetobacteraceae bacterium]|nr:tripartite tricarboxylate transporter substrate-binding protein [Acetobacteraceae bacterium]
MPIARRPLLRAAAAAALLPAAARGQAAPQGGPGPWPNGPVRIIAPFPPGGSVDTLARLVQAPLQQALGVPVVVDNRAGASGSVGTAAAARAVPDGQTFVMVFDTHAVNPFLIPNMGFDTRRDLAPVMLVGTAPMLLTTHRSRPWQTMAEVVAAARARPDTLTYGSIGNGSLAHLTMTLVQRAGGFQVVHVPYRGGGPLAVAAAAGEVDLPVASAAALAAPLASALRPLAQTGARRSPLFPDLPTLAESGIPGIDALAWWGVLAPARTPEPVLRRFHAALRDVLQSPAIRARLADPLGVDLVASEPEAFAAFLDRQMDTWSRVVRENDIRPD